MSLNLVVKEPPHEQWTDDNEDEEDDANIILNNLTSREKLERAKSERELYRQCMHTISDTDIGRVA